MIVSPTAGAAGVAFAWTARSEEVRRHRDQAAKWRSGGGGDADRDRLRRGGLPAAAAVIVAEPARRRGSRRSRCSRPDGDRRRERRRPRSTGARRRALRSARTTRARRSPGARPCTAVPVLVSSSTVSGADTAPGATVSAEDMNASRDGFHASNVRQAVVAPAPPRLPVHQVAPQAASGRSPESAIAAASRTSTASVCALKSAVGMPVRFFGDQA